MWRCACYFFFHNLWHASVKENSIYNKSDSLYIWVKSIKNTQKTLPKHHGIKTVFSDLSEYIHRLTVCSKWNRIWHVCVAKVTNLCQMNLDLASNCKLVHLQWTSLNKQSSSHSYCHSKHVIQFLLQDPGAASNINTLRYRMQAHSQTDKTGTFLLKGWIRKR